MKYLYTALILVFMSQGGATAQEKKSGFFDKVKTTFSSEIKIGTHTFKDGSVYTGEMKGRKPNGKGKTVFKNGNVYEGEYVKGKREGYGTYTFPDGEKYEGQWFQDQQHGKGIYYFMNNNRYDGMWFQDYQQGKGTMYYYTGDIYEGDWVKTVPNMKVPGRMIRKRVKVLLSGMTAVNTKVTGRTMCVMEKELSNMPTEINM